MDFQDCSLIQMKNLGIRLDADSNKNTLDSNYTNITVYLNSLAQYRFIQ